MSFLILRRHVRDQNPLGPDPRRLRRRARLHLGGDGMDRLAARLSAAARPSLVRGARLAGLSAAGVLLVVVRLRRLCAARSSSRAPTSPRPAASPPIVVAIAMSVWRAREAKNVTTYGSARWAETAEVREAGLLGPTASCSAAGATTISATTVRSMCCASRRPAPAKASASSCRRC